jgi:hypothetical protein
VKNNASHSPHLRVAKNPLQCFITFLHDDFMLTSRPLHGQYIKIQVNSHAKYDAKTNALWPNYGPPMVTTTNLKEIFICQNDAQKNAQWPNYGPPMVITSNLKEIFSQSSFDGH